MQKTDYRVRYLGPENQTFGWLVADRLFGSEVLLDPCDDQPKLMKEVIENYQHRAAVVALSNKLGAYGVDGIVNQLPQVPTSTPIALGNMRVNQYLLLHPDAQLRDIQYIYAHNQGWNQGREYLANHRISAEHHAAPSNGAAINLCLQTDSKCTAAIGPSFGMPDNWQKIGPISPQNNVTDFLVFGDKEGCPPLKNITQKYTMIVNITLRNTRGSLHRVLGLSTNINWSSIRSMNTSNGDLMMILSAMGESGDHLTGFTQKLRKKRELVHHAHILGPVPYFSLSS